MGFLCVLVVLACVVRHGHGTTTGFLVESNGEFGLDLYRKLISSSDVDNVFFSPFSISSALAMTYAGARGNTRSQMQDVLGFDSVGDGDSDVHASFQDLFGALGVPTNNYTLNIANRLFGAQGYQWLDAFLDIMLTNYNASLEELNFGDSEVSRTHINKWVEAKTNEKIKDLLPKGSIDASTVLVLVNAIYFKGLWKYPFSPDVTAKMPFSVPSSETVEMDMMTLRQLNFNYIEHNEWDCKIIELPYDGDKASLVIFLPNEEDGLSTIEEKLTIDGLNEAIGSLQSFEMDTVTIPKFKITQGMSLKKFLSELGMEDIFNGGAADLSGMNGVRGLYVTEVMHKAYVDVNEEGTEAAGATGVIVGESVPMNPKQFLANKPFMFLIRDVDTRSILFLGRLIKPPGESETVGQFGAGPDDSTDDGSRNQSVFTITISLAIIALWIARRVNHL